VGSAGPSAGLRVGVRSTFFQKLCIRPTLLGQRERLPHTGTTCKKRMSGIRRLVRKAYVSYVLGFLLHGVYQFESSRLSHMSNCLFVAVIT
jgi:hypothetical protein